jgi:hypothetical protein
MMRLISHLRVDQNQIGVRGQIRIGGYNQLNLRNQGLCNSISLNRLLIDDTFPQEIAKARFGINFAKESHIILSGAFFDQLLIRWQELKGHLIDEDLLNGYLIQQLREGYKKIGWFEDSDQCFKYYIDMRGKALRKNKQYFNFVRLTVLSKFLYGYGIYPSYPIKSGLFIMVFFSFFYLILNDWSRLCNLCPNQLFSAFINASVTSAISFVATPYQVGFLTAFERFLGWIIVSCFLIALANKTLR